jgi:predicted nuclease of predicted toxin-antitoxin system
MLFLANENFPAKSIAVLRSSGHEVISIKEETPGISDISVLNKAKELSAIILTFDKDYGEIIFRNEYTNPPAVVFFRFKGITANYAGDTLVSLITSRLFIIEGFFTVVEEDNIRQRKIV